jgi:hypothetical protein
MNWGKWIIVAFIAFAAFIGSLVAVCVKQDISLVSKDYYKEELEYERQMVRMKNASRLQTRPEISVKKGTLEIAFDRFSEVENGELNLFRPSDSAKDKKFSISKNAGLVQTFSTDMLQPGMYRAKMTWTMNGEEFFLEKIIYI